MKVLGFLALTALAAIITLRFLDASSAKEAAAPSEVSATSNNSHTADFEAERRDAEKRKLALELDRESRRAIAVMEAERLAASREREAERKKTAKELEDTRIQARADKRAQNLKRRQEKERRAAEEQRAVAARKKDARQRLVAPWHDRYVVHVSALKSAIGSYQGAMSGQGDLGVACQALRDTSKELSGSSLIADAPREASAFAEALIHFKAAGRDCLEGKVSTQQHQITEGEKALGRFARALEPYGLRP